MRSRCARARTLWESRSLAPSAPAAMRRRRRWRLLWQAAAHLAAMGIVASASLADYDYNIPPESTRDSGLPRSDGMQVVAKTLTDTTIEKRVKASCMSPHDNNSPLQDGGTHLLRSRECASCVARVSRAPSSHNGNRPFGLEDLLYDHIKDVSSLGCTCVRMGDNEVN